MRRIALVLLILLVRPLAAAETPPPDDTVREFFLAMAASDEARVRKVVLPALYMELLWKNVASSKPQMAELEKVLASLKCRELKEGDSYDLPSGKTSVTAELLDELKQAHARLVVVSVQDKDMPTALTLFDVDGAWKVDASPLIAARLAVKRLSEPKKKPEASK